MATKAEEITITFADGSARTLDPDEASNIFKQLYTLQSKFMPRDIVVDKNYVRKALKIAYSDLKPMELTRRVGYLWGRLTYPSSPFDKFSKRGKKLTRVTRQNPDALQLSGRNLLENHDAFDPPYQYRVGKVTKERFGILIKAIERDLGLSQG